MSKKTFNKTVELSRVTAIPSRTIKDKDGNVIKQLYNIYKLH